MAFTLAVAPAFVDNGAGNAAVTLAGCVSGGTVIIGLLIEQGDANFSDPTCAGEVCHLQGAVSQGLGSGFALQMADCILSGSGSKTFQMVSDQPTPNSQIFAFQINEAATYDNSTNAQTTGANASVSVSISVAHCLLVGQILNKGGDATAGAGFTPVGLDDSIFFDQAEYALDSGATTGNQTVNFTHPSGVYNIQGYAWRPAAVPPASIPLMGQIWV